MSATSQGRGRVVRHPAGHPGTLRTASGEEVAVAAFDGGEEVVLAVLTELGDPPAAEALDPATLEYSSIRGIVRLRGQAELTENAVMRFHADGEPEVVQRRAFVRVHASRPLCLAGTDPVPAVHTVDISGGGMLLFGAERFGLGDLLGFEMDLEEGRRPITGTARVVRIDEDGRRGLRFERIAEEDRQRLIALVFTCLRAARAKTRGDLH